MLYDVAHSDWFILETAPSSGQDGYISAERSLGNHQSAEAIKQVTSQFYFSPTGNSLKRVEYFASVSSHYYFSFLSNSHIHKSWPVFVQRGSGNWRLVYSLLVFSTEVGQALAFI